jgi:hypothetical protein
MKNNTLKVFALLLSGSIILSGCDGLGKMIKKANMITYNVVPKPLEEHGDSIMVNITVKYPEKMFYKKAIVAITPTLKFNGGEKALKSVNAVGEGAVGNGTKITSATGGTLSYSDKIAYQPGMEVAELNLKATATVGTKSKELPMIKIADGTIITPMLVKSDEKPILGKDKFTKITPVSTGANIYFIVNQSNVRPTEMNSAEVKALREFISNGVKKGYTFKGMSVSAYASPDGEQALNGNLAENRAKESIKALQAEFKKSKSPVGTDAAFYNVATTAEDWAGFEAAMKASSIPDKDLVLRVLTMYSDLDQREKEIKNMAKTYTEISNVILPKLRRSVLTLNAEQNSRTDAQISALVASNSDSLSVEEMLYAATLTNDWNAKLNIYKTAETKYGSDWRTSNNVGYVYLMQNKVNDAKAEFEKADKLSANNPVIKNNMGIVARWTGDRKAAAELYAAAAGAGNEVNYNMGVLNIITGDYASAVTNFGAENDFNSALAKLLNGTSESVLTTLDASKENDEALSYYLKAIVGARTNKADLLVNNLKVAISKDASLKAKAKDDCEFLKFRDNADFKALVQ